MNTFYHTFIKSILLFSLMSWFGTLSLKGQKLSEFQLLNKLARWLVRHSLTQHSCTPESYSSLNSNDDSQALQSQLLLYRSPKVFNRLRLINCGNICTNVLEAMSVIYLVFDGNFASFIQMAISFFLFFDCQGWVPSPLLQTKSTYRCK